MVITIATTTTMTMMTTTTTTTIPTAAPKQLFAVVAALTQQSSTTAMNKQSVTATKSKNTMFLSDLKTPCLLFDNDMIIKMFHKQHQSKQKLSKQQHQINDSNGNMISNIPCLQFHDDWILIPQELNDVDSDETLRQQQNEMTTTPSLLFDLRDDDASMPFIEANNNPKWWRFLYIHCHIMHRYEKPKLQLQTNIPNIPFVVDNDNNNDDNYNKNKDDDEDDDMLELVLGLNNHHVISYYWARSAGYGSSMIAPGIRYNPNNQCLYYDDDDNNNNDDNSNVNKQQTNDGKRSEWVQFLQTDDMIQCMPRHYQIQQQLIEYWIQQQQQKQQLLEIETEAKQMNYEQQQSTTTSPLLRIFGISRQNRPLGSEPIVLNEWIMIANHNHLKTINE
jgi:hypothetical protein